MVVVCLFRIQLLFEKNLPPLYSEENRAYVCLRHFQLRKHTLIHAI